MNWLFSPPSLHDAIRLFRAWRLWLLGTLAGALLGASIYYLAPPPYRARATVLVDFNLEQAWPHETDRRQFYYLERETRKLEEIAWSDEVILAVAAADGAATIRHLRDEQLLLGQPGDGGWHFFADDPDPERAASYASGWAHAFTEQALARMGASNGLESFIEIEVTQSADLPLERNTPLGAYLLAGAAGFSLVGALTILFFRPSGSAPQEA